MFCGNSNHHEVYLLEEESRACEMHRRPADHSAAAQLLLHWRLRAPSEPHAAGVTVSRSCAASTQIHLTPTARFIMWGNSLADLPLSSFATYLHMGIKLLQGVQIMLLLRPSLWLYFRTYVQITYHANVRQCGCRASAQLSSLFTNACPKTLQS